MVQEWFDKHNKSEVLIVPKAQYTQASVSFRSQTNPCQGFLWLDACSCVYIEVLINICTFAQNQYCIY